MAAVAGRAARRSLFSAGRWSQTSSSRASHFMTTVETHAAGVPSRRVAAASPKYSLANDGVGGSCLRSRRSILPQIACAQSLLPQHSAMAAARLVSRLSTSSLTSPLLQGSWLSEDI